MQARCRTGGGRAVCLLELPRAAYKRIQSGIPRARGHGTACFKMLPGPLTNREERQEMLLHIFGDTHGPLEINKINPKRFLGRALNDNDAIVICGDFGFPFLPTD